MKKIALLGQPNSGKSTVFNALTCSRQHVGNWPGKTVEKCEGKFTYENETYSLIDLPGSYGLSGNSDEEIITTSYIRSNEADLTIVLVDASQLERSMFMMAEFAKMRKPAILILNMMDVAASQGKTIDADLLSERLGIPVLPFIAAKGKEYNKLKELIKKEIENPHIPIDGPKEKGTYIDTRSTIIEDSKEKYEWIEKILEGVCKTSDKKYTLSKFDKVLTSKFWGKIVCLLIVLAGFIAAMLIMSPFMAVAKMIPQYLGGPIAAGLNALKVHKWLVSIFSLLIPNTVYFVISMGAFVFGVNLVFGFLEEIGFLARAAYQFDSVLSMLGLQGKAVCPIMMGFGCTIGGACGSRVMDNWGQRMLTMVTVWAIPCASIWSVVPVVAGMVFSPFETILICLGIILYAIFMMWLVSLIFGKFLTPKDGNGGMIMELPPFHKPHWGHIFKEALMKFQDIVKRAFITVFLVSLVFWIFSYSPDGNIASSLIYKIGTKIEPVTMFFGLSWRTFMGFISSAFAKEAVLGVLNATYMGQNNIADVAFNGNVVATDMNALSSVMGSMISKPEALAFIFACTFNIPCVMALNTTYKESHSIKWTALVAGFYAGSALLLSCIVYHLALLIF